MLTTLKVIKSDAGVIIHDEVCISGSVNIFHYTNWLFSLKRRACELFSKSGNYQCMLKFNNDGSVVQEEIKECDVSLLAILHIVNKFYGYDISKNTNEHKYSYPRFWYFTLSYILTNNNLEKIGELVGRDHSSVSHGLRTIRNFISIKDSKTLEHLNYFSSVYGIDLERKIKSEKRKIYYENSGKS